jgi:hypothetical protein
MDTCDVAILGAGPYGLSAAAHLSECQSLDFRVIGEPMSFWERHMPAGMLLRSPRVASHISDPHRRFTLDAYEAATGRFTVKMPPVEIEERYALDMARKIPLENFVKYGRWFVRQAGLQLDRRTVSRIDANSGGLELNFEDGSSLQAKKLVIAAGIAPFTRIPKVFRDLPSPLVSHSSQHNDLGKFRDKEVLVIGGGQSALESAVLLNETGARVDVFVRQPMVRWLGIKHQWMHGKTFSWMFYGLADVGPAGVSLLVQRPDLYRRLPRNLQDKWAPRSIRPAASCWVMARASNVPIHTSRSVVWARAEGEKVRIRSNDGCERVFDHILLGTGYQVDIARYPFLSSKVLERIERVAGFPVLDKGFETTLPGLHFVGATATWSFGPLMRFVAGAEFASPAVARRILGARNLRPEAAPAASMQEGTLASSRENALP